MACAFQGYSSSAQTEAAADGLRWVADYFVKCHHSDVAYTGQVQRLHTGNPLTATSLTAARALSFVILPCQTHAMHACW